MREMGRELAMVPPNWDHPKTLSRNGDYSYQPMFRQKFSEAKKEWINGMLAWERGEKPEHTSCEEYWEYYGNPPDKEYYAPFTDGDPECTWYQVWETVSEGTPVTPPFATKEELIDYLSSKGDFWDQARGDGPWNRQSAERFVMGSGWVPSMAIIDGKLMMAKGLG
jgi:hypothetical protein